MWICPKCATQNDDRATVCPLCSTRLLVNVSGGAADHPPASDYPTPADPWAAPPAEPIAPLALSAAPTSPVPASPSRGPASYAPGSAPIAGSILPSTRPYPVAPATVDSPPRGSVPLRWVVALSALLVAGTAVAAAIVVPQLLSGNTTPRSNAAGASGPSTQATTTDPSPEATTTAPATDDHSGLAAVGGGVSDDRADGVAAMLDVYFGGINDKDYDAIATVLAPGGSTDPDNAKQMQRLADGTRTSTDSDITLTSLNDSGGGLLAAEVTFRSDQQSGNGPRERPAETCTRWDIVYTVSGAEPYRISKSKAATAPC
jgi:hypothetical protein